MNTTTHHSRFEQLRPHQVDFIANFIRPDAPRNQMLLAPVGSGRSFTTLALISDLLNQGQARRVLVLVHRVALRDQFAHYARELNLSLPVLTVDGLTFREMVAQADVGFSPWPSDVVAVMLLDLAAKNEIAASLTSIHWDLVVVDDVGSLGASRQGFIRLLSQSDAAKRLLLMSGLPYPDPPSFGISDLTIVNWHRDLADTESAIYRARPDIRVVEYRRSDEEIGFLQNLGTLTEQLSNSATSHLQRHMLLRAAASSPYAAEQSIRKLRNRLAHGEFLRVQETLPETDQLDTEQDTTDEVIVEATSVWLDKGIAWELLSKTLASLDQIRDDSKLRVLVDIIAEQSTLAVPLRLGIYTNFAATAWYLQQQLASKGYEVFRFTGDVSYQERGLRIQRFLESGGILVFSAVGITGIDFRLDTGVLYDLPVSEPMFFQLIARFSLITVSDRPEKSVYLFRDMTRSIPQESERLDRYLNLKFGVA